MIILLKIYLFLSIRVRARFAGICEQILDFFRMLKGNWDASSWHGDFPESCHSWAATQAASSNANSKASSCSSSGLWIHTSSCWLQQQLAPLQRVGLARLAASSTSWRCWQIALVGRHEFDRAVVVPVFVSIHKCCDPSTWLTWDKKCCRLRLALRRPIYALLIAIESLSVFFPEVFLCFHLGCICFFLDLPSMIDHWLRPGNFLPCNI